MRKRMSLAEMKGLQSIKSLHTAGKKSMPREHASAYLQLYILNTEKDRLQKEINIFNKRKEDIKRKLGDIDKEIEKLREVADAERKGRGKFEKPPEKEWKMMRLKY